jgi:cytoskeletal protein RodZ
VESIGEKLRTAREAKKMSIRDVVKETNISPLYLEALEDEKFDKFPSETYLIGFLRSYAEFLRLDVESIIQSYKGYKIGESATPLEELTRPTKSSFMIAMSSFVAKYRNFLMIGGVVLGIVLIGWMISAIFKSNVDVSGGKDIKDEYSAKNKASDIENIRPLQLTNDSGIILVYKNEAVQFLVDNKEVVFLLKEIKGKSVIMEILPGKQNEKIDIEVPKTVKVSGCPREITFTLTGLTENRAKIMVNLGSKIASEADEKQEEAIQKREGDNTMVVAQNKNNLKIVFEAEFTQKSFVELYLDGNRKLRSFVPQGTKERWEATEYMQIKIGNAGGLKARINGKDYTFGGSGQVANKVITWKKDVNNPNLYHVVVKDW